MGNKSPRAELPTASPSQSVQKKASVQLTYEQVRELQTLLCSIRSILENQVQPRTRVKRETSWWVSHCLPSWRRYVAKYILLITAALQSINLMVVSVIDIWPKRDDKAVMDSTGITMLFLQVINLFFIVMVSGSDNALPQEWYNCLFTALQMLMSFVYFASILGQTLSQDTQFWLGVATPDHHTPHTEASTEVENGRHP